MLLAAFFVQPDPAAASLHEIVTHFHLEHGVDAGEGVDHHADEGAIAQADERRFVRFRADGAGRVCDDLDAVEQLAGLLGRQYRRLAFFNDILGAAHGVGRVHIEDVAGDKPVEQHSQGGHVLLHRGRGEFTLQLLHELHVGELADAAPVAPCRKAARGVEVRLARVVVVDLGGEEFEDAPGGLGRRREKRGGLKLGGRGEDDFGSGQGAPFRGVIKDKGRYHTLKQNRKEMVLFTPPC